MNVFNAYSEYYDLLYSSKDYAGETQYIQKLIKKYQPNAIDILELGSGTGLHACLLANEGFHVDGIDQSAPMLLKAESRKKALANPVAQRLSFHIGDIRSFRSAKKYDVVLSLFHVMSYMTSDEDLVFAMLTAAKHLKPGGIFIFDCWHGPGVLHDKPVSRIKQFQNENILVERTSTPEMLNEKHVVNVHFDIHVRSKLDGAETHLQETHGMRYLFPDEVRSFLAQSHFELLHSEEWMTHLSLSENSWNACYICRKTAG